LFPLSHRLAEVGSGRDALEQQVHVIWHQTVRNHFERIRLEKGGSCALTPRAFDGSRKIGLRFHVQDVTKYW